MIGTRFRKKPVVIEAMEFRGITIKTCRDGYAEVFDEWIAQKKGDRSCRYHGQSLIIETLEGEMTATPGDWIICGVAGELYPCNPAIFAETYEAEGTAK